MPSTWTRPRITTVPAVGVHHQLPAFHRFQSPAHRIRRHQRPCRTLGPVYLGRTEIARQPNHHPPWPGTRPACPGAGRRDFHAPAPQAGRIRWPHFHRGAHSPAMGSASGTRRNAFVRGQELCRRHPPRQRRRLPARERPATASSQRAQGGHALRAVSGARSYRRPVQAGHRRHAGTLPFAGKPVDGRCRVGARHAGTAVRDETRPHRAARRHRADAGDLAEPRSPASGVVHQGTQGVLPRHP